jgi:signal transduction histidine kinase
VSERVRAWVPSVAVGLLVLAVGLFEAQAAPPQYTYLDGDVFVEVRTAELRLLAVAVAIAIALCRRAPAVALALSACVGLAQVAGNTPVLLVEVAFFAVVFATARWGHPVTAAAGALMVPAAAAMAITLVSQQDTLPLLSLVDASRLRDATYSFASTWRVGAGIILALLLAAPWLAGIALRFVDRARVSRLSQQRAEEQTALAQRETEQAREIARLRDEQARLARDVHDVVGHSLAVILAQAESAQYLPDDDPDRLKQTLATIATSARSSLQDVRQVLSAPDAGPAQARPLDTLVDGVRAGGHEVVLRELGTARPLPPDLEVTAYRVLQEMLTNAVKHGRRDEPVFVERHWPDGSHADDLRVEVRNTVSGAPEGKGQGLDGMRERLATVGGRLDVRRREEAEGTSFTATAWLPLGPR